MHTLTCVHSNLLVNNYTVWRSLFSTFLRSHDLLGYVEGHVTQPAEGDPALARWLRTDDHIKSWLLATLSESLLEEVHDLQTSKAVWDALHNRYIDSSRTRTMDMRMSLLNNKLTDHATVDDYLRAIKVFSDQLRAAGSPLNTEDMIAYALLGFPPEDMSLTTTFSNGREPLTFEQLCTKLMHHESRLQQLKTLTPNARANTAFHVQTQPGGHSGGNCGGNHGYNNGGYQQNRGGGHAGRGGGGNLQNAWGRVKIGNQSTHGNPGHGRGGHAQKQNHITNAPGLVRSVNHASSYFSDVATGSGSGNSLSIVQFPGTLRQTVGGPTRWNNLMGLLSLRLLSPIQSLSPSPHGLL
ncbi:hypothetical protein CRG98_022960 [Punica granatum]|uniref:Uncharacterized protein n=1 Tax=Punica granatum TaxID=22663 RepID=A0A2I0JK55_PUNGR|nr:hypothetical protein CRG98_022960 [Punica granatum]